MQILIKLIEFIFKIFIVNGKLHILFNTENKNCVHLNLIFAIWKQTDKKK